MVCEPRVPVARGQTPDWIKDVFELVKKGETEKLKNKLINKSKNLPQQLLTLKNMDAILIRNLSDQHGNNLFHVCAWNGQVECVKVLLEQGQECKEALYDENKQGFTPIVLSIKRGHLEFLKFLIECSDMRDRLLSDNSRPLIHWAAKYGQ
uniref:Uncharacterized protein n=1 Tax=Strigamia maritima TaxID=126957 RepID=T1JER7_STRMM